jgi:hypothetical protein
MKTCRVCRTLYPEIVPEVDDVCLDCRRETWEAVSLDQVASDMERELAGWQEPLQVAIAEQV